MTLLPASMMERPQWCETSPPDRRPRHHSDTAAAERLG